MKPAILDYGAGNLRSIVNACRYLGVEAEIVSNPGKLKSADKIILPGVGNFGDAMRKLEKFKDIITEKVSDGTPFLGLCLGIQVIFEKSEESPGSRGLGIFKGACKRLPEDVNTKPFGFRSYEIPKEFRIKVPHIGWNSIEIVKKNIPILKGIPSGSYFYFVHSYYPVPTDKEIIAATTQYGVKFTSVIAKDDVFAVQFHPEKSGMSGLKILENFLDL